MAQLAQWPEVESEVNPAGNWVPIALGAIFLLVGFGGLCVGWNTDRGGMTSWLLGSITGFVALMGTLIFIKSVRMTLWRRRVRHAAPDVLPDVPREPMTLDRSVVTARLMHELIEDSAGWQLRPSETLRYNDRLILLRFGIPFCVAVAGLLMLVIHNQHIEGGWPAAILLGVVITLFCGGSVIIATLLLSRSQFGQLSRLIIPNHAGDLELELSPQQNAQNTARVAKTRLANAGNRATVRLTIPREKLLAVQLCPWLLSQSSEWERATTWAAQGLLVTAGSEVASYCRLPILLTSDLPGAACLMQELAAVLRVPYLFGADAAGWRLEEKLAPHRPPLKAAGTST